MTTTTNDAAGSQSDGTSGGNVAALVIAWLLVGLPLLWGVEQTLMKALALFR